MAHLKVRIAQGEYKRMLDEAKLRAPLEACGLLGGRDIDGTRYVERVYLLQNVEASQEHFTLDPAEQLAAVRDMRARKLELVGNWHSHPATPSRPSTEDIRLAYDVRLSHFILSLAGEEPVLRSFCIEGGTATAQDLEIG